MSSRCESANPSTRPRQPNLNKLSRQVGTSRTDSVMRVQASVGECSSDPPILLEWIVAVGLGVWISEGKRCGDTKVDEFDNGWILS